MNKATGLTWEVVSPPPHREPVVKTGPQPLSCYRTGGNPQCDNLREKRLGSGLRKGYGKTLKETKKASEPTADGIIIAGSSVLEEGTPL